MKRMILTFEFDMGDYSDVEEEGYTLPITPVEVIESCDLHNINVSEMKLVGVHYEE